MTKQVFKNCLRCTKVFEPPVNKRKTRVYCSRSCANKTNGSVQSVTKRQKTKYNFGSKAWRYTILYIEWRNFCIARDSSICQECKKPLNSRQLVVHHIKSWEHYPKLRYKVDNGVVLCRSCHNRIHILPSRKQKSGF